MEAWPGTCHLAAAPETSDTRSLTARYAGYALNSRVQFIKNRVICTIRFTMKISMQEICEFALTKPSNKNFIGGESVLNAGHILSCGRTSTEVDTNYEIMAFCLQTSQLKSAPHEIKGEITKAGKIESMQCTCKAGLGSACKHVVGVLLYCNRYDLEDLNIISCTDKKCLWNKPQQSSLEKYEPQPLEQHNCFLAKKRQALVGKTKGQTKEYDGKTTNLSNGALSLTNEQEAVFKEILATNNPSSALAKHMRGRHEPLDACNNNVLTSNPKQVDAIFEQQKASDFLHKLHEIEFKPLRECCENVLTRLEKEVHTICIESKDLFTVWCYERQFRVTGSRAYALFTYSKNKNPDWEKKSLSYFYAKSFSNCYTKHGLDNEPLARKAYEDSTSRKVIECGLVVSIENPWLGYSPDGIVFENDRPVKLIEIKCPFEGKKKPMSEVIKSIKWLTIEKDQLTLKKQHAYYAQIQLGMTVLNLQETDFIIYSPFDKGLTTLSVPFDIRYAEKLLYSLKINYFYNMLHHVCEKEKEEEKACN